MPKPIDVQPQEKPVYPEPLGFWKLLLKATALAVFFAFVMLLITAGVVAAYIYKQASVFATAADTSIAELRTTIETGWQATPLQTDGHKNILLLGTDSLATRGSVPPLTDTMLLISLDTTTGTIYTLPLPRDIWSAEYQTKINALYAYGSERYPETPEQFPREVLSTLTGIPIHHTVVLRMETVEQAINALGGIEVTVTEGFTDTEFPRSDVDITQERDPAKLYQTVSFTAGRQHMNGETALQYMRSRHSSGDTGTDIARGERQQAVLTALLERVQSEEILGNPKKLGELYRFYSDTFGEVFSVQEAVATAATLYRNKATIAHVQNTISIYPEDPTGVLSNPPISKYKQWVYEVRDQEAFSAEVHRDLGIRQ